MDNVTTISNSTTSISIPAGQFRILGNQPSTLAVDEFSLNRQVAIYPNPVTDTFTIKTNVTSLNIYDITGKLVIEFRGQFRAGEEFNISNLNKGIYLIELKNEVGQKSNSKLIKL
jgi:hypothetical protein